jgi:hypothetical protein
MSSQETGNIKVDAEFCTFIGTLTPEERNQLKENLSADGCRDPLVTWNGVLLDGYHRYELCQELGIGYETRELTTIKDREDAKRWIIQNQIGRRNLSDYQRVELALHFKPQIQAEARDNLKTGSSGKRGGSPLLNFAKRINTRKELARIAEVSEETLRKAELINRNGPEETKERLRRGKTSINEEYEKLVQSGSILSCRTGRNPIGTIALQPQHSKIGPEVTEVIDTFFRRADKIRISAAAKELSTEEAERLLRLIYASVVWLKELEGLLKRRLLAPR